jgi:GR25 family glycosyltransferase involved in LPS biosynthesis
MEIQEKLNGISVFCINLKRAKQRYDRMSTFFEKYPHFHFVDAIDGNHLANYPQLKYPLFTPKNKYEIACIFSHLSAIYKAYQTGKEHCLIIEDDMDISVLKKWDFDINTIINKAPLDWQILQLYTNHPLLIQELHDSFNKKDHLWAKWCAISWSAGFYVIRRNGMKALLDMYQTASLGFDLDHFPYEKRFCVADILLYANINSYTITKPIMWEDANETFIQPKEHFDTFHPCAKRIIQNLYADTKISFEIKNEMKNMIYFNGFWKGFVEKEDAVHCGLVQFLFSFLNYEITTNIFEANVLIESVFATSLVTHHNWKYKILISGESYVHQNPSDYNIVLGGFYKKNNIVCFPFLFQYLHCQNKFSSFTRTITRTNIAPEFCCFIVSNPNSAPRNKMFALLNQYKRVHSFGKYQNNMGKQINDPYWSDEYRKKMSEYKFVICFENRKLEAYLTEKIANPFLTECIPIYWGSDFVHTIFNKDAFLYLENESDEAYHHLVKKIVEIDNNPELYWKMIRTPIVKDSAFEPYTLENVSNQIRANYNMLQLS